MSLGHGAQKQWRLRLQIARTTRQRRIHPNTSLGKIAQARGQIAILLHAKDYCSCLLRRPPAGSCTSLRKHKCSEPYTLKCVTDMLFLLEYSLHFADKRYKIVFPSVESALFK